MVVRRQLLDAVVCYFLLLVVLGSRWELDFNIAIERSNFYFGAQDCLCYAQVEVSMDVRPLSLKVIVGSDFYIYNEVTVGSTHPSMPLF